MPSAARVGFEITSETFIPLPVRPVIEFALNCAVLANMVGILDDDSSVHPRNKESVNRSELEAIEDKEEHQKPTSKKQDEKTNRANPCSSLSNKSQLATMVAGLTLMGHHSTAEETTTDNNQRNVKYILTAEDLNNIGRHPDFPYRRLLPTN